MIRDKNIAWKTKRVYLPCFNMGGVLADAAQGAGAPVFAAHSVAASELVIMQVAAAGDEVYTFWPFPQDFDADYPLRFRIWFSHSSTTADTPDWVLSYKALGDGDAITDAKDSADEDVAFAAAAVSTTANALEVLDWEKSVSNTKIDSTDHALMMALECNGLGGASANEIEVFGIEVEYTIQATASDGRKHDTNDEPVAP